MNLKQYLAIFLLLTVSVQAADYRSEKLKVVAWQKSHSSAAASFHQEQTNAGGDLADWNSLYFASDANSKNLASSFVASSSYSLRRVTVKMARQGTSAAYTFVAKVYSSTGSPACPNAQMGSDSTTSINVTSISTSAQDVTLDFGADIALTSGTKYFIVLAATGTAGTSFDGAEWLIDSTHTGSQSQCESPNLSSWSNLLANADPSLTIFSFH